MDIQTILSHCDHTLLSQTATWDQIRAVLDDGIRYRTASACIPAAYVKEAAAYAGGKLPICTVIGFPNGYSTTAAKCFETEDAVKNGADEIDMVIHIGWLKDRRYDDLLREIRAVKDACGGKILKVIIETCLLTEEEKIKMCEIVTEARADFIKTSFLCMQLSTDFQLEAILCISLFYNYICTLFSGFQISGCKSIYDAASFFL